MKHTPTLSTMRELLVDVPGSSINERAVLLLVAEDVRRPMSHVAREVGVTAGAITTIVDRLEAHGFVKRTSYDDDRRSTYLQITTKGAKIIARAEKRAIKGAA